MAEKVKKGDKIKLHYTGRIKNGETFDSSRKGEPIQFEAGTGQIIKGLDEAVIGMEPGDKKNIKVVPENAYGDYNKELLIEVPKEMLPQDISPKEGSTLSLVDKEGRAIPVKITEIKEESIKVDANHPLAGKELDFDIELMEIV